MNRSAADVIRRGFEQTVANWPLLLIRIAVHIVATLLCIGALLVIIVPIAVSAGLGQFDLNTPDDVPNMIVRALIDHWMLFVFILLVITVLLGVIIAIHSFVQAGSADVYAAGDAFSGERFVEGGKRGWLRIFWIYNLAWLFCGVVLLIPIMPVPFLMIAIGQSMAAIAVGCAVLALWFVLAMIVGTITALWVEKAVAVAMLRNLQAREALREARREIRARLGVHLGVGLIILVIWCAVMSVVGGATGFMSFGHVSPLAVITAPAHIALSLVQGIFSAAIQAWFLASFINLTEP